MATHMQSVQTARRIAQRRMPGREDVILAMHARKRYKSLRDVDLHTLSRMFQSARIALAATLSDVELIEPSQVQIEQIFEAYESQEPQVIAQLGLNVAASFAAIV